jgi:transcription initiation factor TFIIH subunit 3
MIKDEKPGEEQSQRVIKSSLLPGSSGSPDGPEQHVAVMNATFSTPCSLMPIDSCQVGAHNPIFL